MVVYNRVLHNCNFSTKRIVHTLTCPSGAQTHLVIPLSPHAPVLRSSTKAFVSNTPSSVTGKRTLELPIRIDKIKGRGEIQYRLHINLKGVEKMK